MAGVSSSDFARAEVHEPNLGDLPGESPAVPIAGVLGLQEPGGPASSALRPASVDRSIRRPETVGGLVSEESGWMG